MQVGEAVIVILLLSIKLFPLLSSAELLTLLANMSLKNYKQLLKQSFYWTQPRTCTDANSCLNASRASSKGSAATVASRTLDVTRSACGVPLTKHKAKSAASQQSVRSRCCFNCTLTRSAKNSSLVSKPLRGRPQQDEGWMNSEKRKTAS